MVKRDIESLLAHDVISVSSDESDSDDGNESNTGDKVESEASDATRPKKKQQQAKPDVEPDLELRKEIDHIVARVTEWKKDLAKKQENFNDMKKMTAGKSLEDLDKVKKRYIKLIDNFNKKRKSGFKDFEMAWKGVCPGCDDCVGQGSRLPTEKYRHPIGSMDTTTEAWTVGAFCQGVVALNTRLIAIQAGGLGQQEEEKKEKENGEEEEGAGTL